MTSAMPDTRKSDRWITPGVIIAAIITTGLVVVGVALSVAYLTARGIDPDPMLKLVAQVGTGVAALINVALTLAGRTTAAKTERNTGVLAGTVANVAGTVYDVADRLKKPAPVPVVTSASTAQLPPVPAATR